MRRLLVTILLASATLPLTAQTPRPFDSWVQRYSDEWMRFHSDLAAARRYFKGPEQDAIERQLEPPTAAHRKAELALIDRGIDALARFAPASLSESERRSLQIIRWDLESQREAAAFDDYQFPFRQNYGVDAELISTLTIDHTLHTARDADNYLARLALVGERMDQATAEGRRLAAAKLLPPRFILQTTASLMQDFLKLEPAANPFVTAFADKLQAIDGLSDAQGQALRASAERITSTSIYPAWRRALALLEETQVLATDAAGLSRFPRGREAYAAALRRFTTTDMTADQIHDVGLKMVSELEGRMDGLLRQLHYTDGPLRQRMDGLREDQRTFPDTPAGRAQYNQVITDIIRDAERRAATLFTRVPKMPVVARAYPDFMRGRAASYSLGTTDGARPGTYQYAVTGVTMTTFGLRTTAYHEAVPGHHFQGALQAENSSLPAFLRSRIFGNNSAIGEGWGLYAEHLAAEQGWYDGDPAGLLGQLQMELFRARRLVIDTGLHAKGWTRSQAVEYLGPLPGLSPESEIDRYVSMPGQACSYMIGELRLIELRERARQALGPRFSLAEFHTRVLSAGRVPLSVLDQDIVRWIGDTQAN